MMIILYYIFSAIFIMATLLPLVSDQHWFFRIWDFGKVQVTIFQVILFTLGIIFVNDYSLLYIVFQTILFI